MKIYCDAKYIYDINNLFNSLKNTDILHTTYTYNDFYSENGIFRLQDDNFYKCRIIDKPLSKIIHNNIEYKIDNSIIGFPNSSNNKYTQLPYNHVHKQYTEHMFKLRNKAMLSFNFILNNENNIDDWFFETKEEFDTIKEDIDEFMLFIKK